MASQFDFVKAIKLKDDITLLDSSIGLYLYSIKTFFGGGYIVTNNKIVTNNDDDFRLLCRTEINDFEKHVTPHYDKDYIINTWRVELAEDMILYNKKDKILSCFKKNKYIRNYKFIMNNGILTSNKTQHDNFHEDEIILIPNTNMYMLFSNKYLNTIIDKNTLQVVSKFDNCKCIPDTIVNKEFVDNKIILLTQIKNKELSLLIYNYHNNTIMSKIVSKKEDTLPTYDVILDNKKNMFIVVNDYEKKHLINITNKNTNEDECVICSKEFIKSQVIVPCGHTQICKTCIEQCTECPICRGKKQDVIKIYL